jgi:RecJ-like exonuclease
MAARKIRKRPGPWFAGYMRRMGGRLFAVHDAQARQHGWQITLQRGGLSRSYRDPRFDLLVTCPDCRGTGIGAGDGQCHGCPGTGRLALDRYCGPAAR